MLPFFVSVTLLALVRISKTRYRWKDLSLLTLSLTNLLTYTETLMDPGRKICIVPGTKTTNAVIEGLNFPSAHKTLLNRGYYTVARRYEFYFRVAKQYCTNERTFYYIDKMTSIK